jgi:hypothetical protein
MTTINVIVFEKLGACSQNLGDIARTQQTWSYVDASSYMVYIWMLVKLHKVWYYFA